VRKILVFVFVGMLGAAAGARAKTPDGKPPSVETVCDNEKGAAFGLCNAYCEAMDCDSPNHHASDGACAAVKKNFEKKTGRPLPCDVTCPCGGLLPVFGDIVNGTAGVQLCLIDDSFISVITDSDDFAMVVAGPPPTCSVDLEPPFVELTATEALVCRVTLRQAAEKQVPCVPPE
jgi:hypothetical protein